MGNIGSFRLATTAGVLLVSGLLSACGGGGADGGQGGGGDPAQRNVVVAYANTINTLDPQHADYAMTNTVISAVYDALVTFDAQGKLVGDLASSYSLSPDATSVDITLRDDVTFHDGGKLTADDVKFTLDRYHQIGQGIAGVLSGYDSTQVKDPTHLTIKLAAPNATFLSQLSKAYILEASLVKAHAGSDNGQSWLQTNDAGTGPYQLTGSPVSGDIVAKRYDKYFQFDAKRPGSFTFKRIDQNATQLAELKAGNVDVAINLTAQGAEGLKGDGIAAAFLQPAVQTYIVANTKIGPTANPAVRKALRLGYDYQGGLSKILDGKGTIANGILPASVPCRPDEPTSAQDVAGAKKLLADAGITNLTLTLRYQPNNAVQTQEATLFQSNMRDIGVTINLEPIAFADYLTLLGDPNKIPELMLLNDQAQVPDPGVVLNSTYRTAAIGTTNKSAYSNPQVDQLLTKAMASGNADERCTLYKQAQQIIYDAAVTVNMYSVVYPVGYRTDLSGVVVNPIVNPLAVAGIRVG